MLGTEQVGGPILGQICVMSFMNVAKGKYFS
jgi:hypothetical protein